MVRFCSRSINKIVPYLVVITIPNKVFQLIWIILKDKSQYAHILNNYASTMISIMNDRTTSIKSLQQACAY